MPTLVKLEKCLWMLLRSRRFVHEPTANERSSPGWKLWVAFLFPWKQRKKLGAVVQLKSYNYYNRESSSVRWWWKEAFSRYFRVSSHLEVLEFSSSLSKAAATKTVELQDFTSSCQEGFLLSLLCFKLSHFSKAGKTRVFWAMALSCLVSKQ